MNNEQCLWLHFIVKFYSSAARSDPVQHIHSHPLQALRRENH